MHRGAVRLRVRSAVVAIAQGRVGGGRKIATGETVRRRSRKRLAERSQGQFGNGHLRIVALEKPFKLTVERRRDCNRFEVGN